MIHPKMYRLCRRHLRPGLPALSRKLPHAPTPSYARVSQPLNDRSVGCWKHYAKPLAPYMAAIGPVIEALGYSAQAPAIHSRN